MKKILFWPVKEKHVLHNKHFRLECISPFQFGNELILHVNMISILNESNQNNASRYLYMNYYENEQREQ